jgi:hypothetical protein
MMGLPRPLERHEEPATAAAAVVDAVQELPWTTFHPLKTS